MDDFVIASPAGDGSVQVVWSDHVERLVLASVVELVVILENGGKRGFFRHDLTPRRMFGKTYLDWKRSKQFWQTHGVQMQAQVLAAARRVRDRWPAPGLFQLKPDAVDDWFMVCGHAISLYADRNGPNPLQGTFGRGPAHWLWATQYEIAYARWCDYGLPP